MTDIDPVDVEIDPDENINDQNPEDDGPDPNYYNTAVTAGDTTPAQVHALVAGPPQTFRILEQIITHFPDYSHVYVTSTTGGTHARNSYHYRGEAIDVGSASQKYKDELAAWLYDHYADITELIHSRAGDDSGWYVKNGTRVGHGHYGKKTTLAHVNHVHLAVATVAKANDLLDAVKGSAEKTTGYVYPTSKPPYPGVLKENAFSNAVRTLQRRLNIRGYTPKLHEDGHFGPDTTRNVRKFQGWAGLPRTGIMDQATFNALWDLKIT